MTLLYVYKLTWSAQSVACHKQINYITEKQKSAVVYISAPLHNHSAPRFCTSLLSTFSVLNWSTVSDLKLEGAYTEINIYISNNLL